jgi:hypothetical protein
VTEEPLAAELLPLEDDELDDGELEAVLDGALVEPLLDGELAAVVDVVAVDAVLVPVDVVDGLEVVAVPRELVFASAGSWPVTSCTPMNSQAAANSPAAEAITRLRMRRLRCASACLRDRPVVGRSGISPAVSCSRVMVSFVLHSRSG